MISHVINNEQKCKQLIKPCNTEITCRSGYGKQVITLEWPNGVLSGNFNVIPLNSYIDITNTLLNLTPGSYMTMYVTEKSDAFAKFYSYM